MKAIFLAIAVFATGIWARDNARHRHEAFHARELLLTTATAPDPTCECKTVYNTITGPGVLQFPAEPSATASGLLVATEAAQSSEAKPTSIPSAPAPAAENAPASTPSAIEQSSASVPLAADKASASTPSAADQAFASASPSSEQASAPNLNKTLVQGSSSSSPALLSAPASSPPNLGSSTGKWAITYSPYQGNGACKDASSVWADVATISQVGFKAIRIYSTDCSGLENVGKAVEALQLKLIVGIFINDSGTSGAAEQANQIAKWGKWDLVELVVIGNEAIFSNKASPGDLANFVRSTKSTLKSAGYNGPSTTTEPLNVWRQHTDVLCDAVDIVACNIHPFFNPDIDPASAGPFVQAQIQEVNNLCPGKPGYNLESGWPSSGTCNGKACPGKSEQAAAIKSIEQHAGERSVIFSFTDDHWKTPGAFGVEQSFGAIQLFTGSF